MRAVRGTRGTEAVCKAGGTDWLPPFHVAFSDAHAWSQNAVQSYMIPNVSDFDRPGHESLYESPLFHTQGAVEVQIRPDQATYVVASSVPINVTKGMQFDTEIMGCLQPSSLCRVSSILELNGKRLRARICEPFKGWVTAKLLVCRDAQCGYCQRCDVVTTLDFRKGAKREQEMRKSRLNAAATETRDAVTRAKLWDLKTEATQPVEQPEEVDIRGQRVYKLLGHSSVRISASMDMSSADVGHLETGAACVVESMLEINGRRLRARISEPCVGWVTASLLVCSDWSCGYCRRCETAGVQKPQSHATYQSPTSEICPSMELTVSKFSNNNKAKDKEYDNERHVGQTFSPQHSLSTNRLSMSHTSRDEEWFPSPKLEAAYMYGSPSLEGINQDQDQDQDRWLPSPTSPSRSSPSLDAERSIGGPIDLTEPIHEPPADGLQKKLHATCTAMKAEDASYVESRKSSAVTIQSCSTVQSCYSTVEDMSVADEGDLEQFVAIISIEDEDPAAH